MLNDLITFILKFEGIIGALLGVVTTLIATKLLKDIGKIYYEFYDYEFDYRAFEYGCFVKVEDISKAEYYNYKFRIQLYNNSENIKILKDIQIELEFENDYIYSKPHDSNMTEYGQFHSTTKDLNIINIPPKQIVEINIDGRIENLRNIVQSKIIKNVYFSANNYKNRKIKKVIKKF